MNYTNNPEKPVILFIPEIGIYPFARGLAVLGDAIVKHGGRVFVVRDTGQMLRSPIMAMNNLSIPSSEKEKEKIYKDNEKIFKMVKKNYKFSFIELSDFVDEKIIKEINGLVDNVPTNSLKDIVYRGFPVGEIAQYDFALETKYSYYDDLSDAHKALYSTYIKNTALALAITDFICEKYSPSLFLTFNEYAQCQAVRYGATKNNVSRMALTYPVHLNVDSSRFSIWNTTFEYWMYNHCQRWKNDGNFCIDPQSVKDCWMDTVFRMYSSGSHIFSFAKQKDPESIFKKLQLDKRKKTIVVYTSSRDERTGIDIAMKIWNENNHINDAFQSQIDWLLMLQKYAGDRNDVQFVVRIHPREGVRGRGFDSQHLKLLKEKFVNNTKNFTIVWPDDQISSYDLIELADVCLVSWSLMGQEAARLGTPVLAYTGNMFYPDDDFIQVANSLESYKIKLDKILKMEYSWNHLIKAVRFYNWRTFIPTLNLGDTVPVDVQDDTVWPSASKYNTKIINDILNGNQDLIEHNIKEWHSSLQEDSLVKELEAMQQGIRYFLDKIFYPPISYKQKYGIFYRIYRKARKITFHLFGKKVFEKQAKNFKFSDYSLEYIEIEPNLKDLSEKTKTNKNLRVIVLEGDCVVLVNRGKILRRMSPVVSRLVKLYNSSFLSK